MKFEAENITGNVYDRLTVLEFSHKTKRGDYFWLCRCICGNQVVVKKCRLTDKNKPKRSCGCLLRETRSLNGRRTFKHGLTGKHPLYYVWAQMHHRCKTKSCKSWWRYGGRGIQVCQEWSDFTVFLADMGERPEGYSLDRIDNDQGYSAANCRWATDKEQANNKRKAGTALRDYLNYQTGLQFIAALLGPMLRRSA